MGYASDAPGSRGKKSKGGTEPMSNGKAFYPSVDGLKDSDKNAAKLNSGSNAGRRAVRYASARDQQVTYTGK